MSATVDGDVVRVVDEPQQGVPWRRIGVLVGSGLALALVLVGIGRAITALPESNAFLVWEEGVNTWFVSIRTPTLDTLTHVGSYLAETVTCIAVLVLAMAVCRWKTGRWFEAWVVCAAIVGELWVFLVVTFLVDRARPDVPHLDAAPPTSSFPSGHTGAAVALYGCIAILLWRSSQRRGPWVRAVVVACCVVPVVVAVSRVYRGMHHVSDVLFGAIGGGVWLLIVVTVLLSLHPPRHVDVRDGEAAELPGP